MVTFDVENPVIPHHTERDICAHTRIGPTGIEWICIREPHDAIYKNRTNRMIQHYMVNRWPFREQPDNENTM